jgi:predicted phosphate transport protein (TIGR00153 family)
VEVSGRVAALTWRAGGVPMRLAIFPKNDQFFELFSESAAVTREAAEFLLEMVQDFTDVPAKATRLKAIESRGDKVTYEIIEHLNASFITPIDREDIYALARTMDDVMDEIEGVGSRMDLFNVHKPTAECVELIKIIVGAAEKIEQAVSRLKSFRNIRDLLADVRELEHQADHITRRMTAKLFHEGDDDVVHLIKWKEIYARLEHTADKMEDVANIIEDIVVKNQ